MRIRLLLALSLGVAVPVTWAAPHVTTIAPRGGSIAGGRTFSLRGLDFDQLPAGTLGVLFGGTPATDVTLRNPREIRGTTPAHAEGTVDVVIAIDGVAVDAAGSASYRYGKGSAVPCDAAADCDDGDPCTVDACATTCANAAVDSPDDLTATAAACSGLTVPAKIGKKFLAGCGALARRAGAPTDKKKAKLQTLAVKSFTKAGKIAGKAKALAGDCATQLGATLSGAIGFAQGQ